MAGSGVTCAVRICLTNHESLVVSAYALKTKVELYKDQDDNPLYSGL
jgi:hypothetical protein